MSEPTDDELFEALRRGKAAVQELVAAARLAGWEECREACKAAVQNELICDEDIEHDRLHGKHEGDLAYNLALKHATGAIAALTPPTK